MKNYLNKILIPAFLIMLSSSCEKKYDQYDSEPLPETTAAGGFRFEAVNLVKQLKIQRDTIKFFTDTISVFKDSLLATLLDDSSKIAAAYDKEIDLKNEEINEKKFTVNQILKFDTAKNGGVPSADFVQGVDSAVNTLGKVQSVTIGSITVDSATRVDAFKQALTDSVKAIRDRIEPKLAAKQMERDALRDSIMRYTDLVESFNPKGKTDIQDYIKQSYKRGNGTSAVPDTVHIVYTQDVINILPEIDNTKLWAYQLQIPIVSTVDENKRSFQFDGKKVNIDQQQRGKIKLSGDDISVLHGKKFETFVDGTLKMTYLFQVVGKDGYVSE